MKLNANKNPSKPYIIFDIDGTLANIEHRLHHIEGEKKNWDAFNDAMLGDRLNKHVAAVYYAMCGVGAQSQHPSIFVTGRPETHLLHTKHWLHEHSLHPNYLYMRPKGDYRSDYIVKKEIYDKYICGAPILFVMDDRQQVVDMWRSLKLKCFQVQKGDY